MAHVSKRNPRIIDIQPTQSRHETIPFHDPLDIFGKKFSTGLDRNRAEMAFLGARLRESTKPALRILQVGIGENFVGETVNILDALERTGKQYELICMDSNLWITLKHAAQDEFIAKGDYYRLLDVPPAELRKLVFDLACIENIREIRTPDKLGIFAAAFDGAQLMDFRFDIPQRILDCITYIIGDTAKDGIPADLLGEGFDAVVCFHTLYHIDDREDVRHAVQNLIRYLSAHGLLAIDTGKGMLRSLFGQNLERLPNMRCVFGPNRELGGQTDSYYVFEKSASAND